MRKLLFLIPFCALFTSCDTSKKERLIKPFIITDISYGCCNGETASEYTYQDVNGNWESFTDKNDKFTVGDTLK